jgi:DNA-binding NarL/FixJ family response regulator
MTSLTENTVCILTSLTIGATASFLYFKIRRIKRYKKLKAKRVIHINMIQENAFSNVDSTLIQNKEELNFLSDNSKLTVRELEIMSGILNNESYKTLAEKLYISESTISKHASNIFRKLNCKNKKELIEFSQKKSFKIEEFQN